MDLDDVSLLINRALVGSLFEVCNGDKAALLANVDSATKGRKEGRKEGGKKEAFEILKKESSLLVSVVQSKSISPTDL